MELFKNELTLRLGFFFGVFFIMAAVEYFRPFRELGLKRLSRWPNNLGLVALNSVLIKLVFPVSAVMFADFVARQGWGVFNLVNLPGVLEATLAVILLDMAIYWQHVAFHHVPILWRLHRMHHADTDFDVTLGAKFHPIEILLSMLIKFWVILALGANPLSVLIFEVLLNATAMFNHSNFTLPKKFDNFLRFFLVTPDMHRIHHSVIVNETNSNYGFNLTWWDKLFGTYIREPRNNPKTMDIGLEYFRSPKEGQIHWLITQPFRDSKK